MILPAMIPWILLKMGFVDMNLLVGAIQLCQMESFQLGEIEL